MRLRPGLLPAAFAALALVAGSLGLAPGAASAAPTTLYFSEYVEGTSFNKALEIHNPSAAAVDLTGWSVELYFNGNPTLTTSPVALAGPAVAPGDVFVVAHSSAGAAVLAAADQTSGSLSFNGDDAVVLRAPTGAVADTIGQVGFDPGTEWGSGLTSTADNTLRRTFGSGPDTDPSNVFDPAAGWDGYAVDTFDGLGFHGTSSDDTAPTVASTVPADNATGVPADSNISVTFSEPVIATSTAFSLSCAGSAPLATTVTGGPTTFTLDPAADFGTNQVCTVTVVASEVTDQDATDPPDAMAANYVFDFTAAGAALRIREVQGAAHLSSYAGQTVTLAPAVVTARRSNGYYLQDPAPDADDATSEGIFVFTGANPATPVAVGDSLSVSGTVTEFRAGAAGEANASLTLTEITSPTTTVLSSGNLLPAATLIGQGGRVPPTEVIEDDASNVEAGGVFDPAQDGIDFYESLEGMRVQVNNAVASGPRNRFGEISVLADDGAGAGVRTSRGGIVVRPSDFNPERIILDDAIVPTPAVNVGDHFSGPVVGVMDYAFNNFKLNVTSAVTAVSDGVTRETTTPTPAGQLSVATINVENLDPGDGADKINRLAAIIVDNMASPDLLSLEEIQDNNGPTNDSVVDAGASYNALISAISAAGGPAYEFRQINPLDDQDGGEPGGNIRVGFLFRTDRGLQFVDRPGGDATTAVTVQPGPQLSVSPGRIAPTEAAWNSSRKPLAGEFVFNGNTLFVVANHFSSKGGDQPLYGRYQPPTRSSEVQRHQQAQLVNDFVDAVLAEDADANVVVMGDINDFEFSQTMSILEGGVMTALMRTLPQAERYSYVFDGNSQSLDHIVVSNNMLPTVADFDVVHVNAEFADQASDHDPMVARLVLVPPNAQPTVDAGGPYTVSEGGNATLSADGSDGDGDDLTYAWDLDNDGAFDDATGETVTFSAGGLDGPTTKTVAVRVSDGNGGTAVDAATVNVRNVVPSISAVTAGANATCGAASSVTVSFTDPGSDETFDATVNWGDGTIQQVTGVSSPFSPTHTFTTAGQHVVSVTVTDDDGGVSAPSGVAVHVDYTVVDGGVQQPLNATGPMSVFKSRSVIAVKVQLQDCDGTFPGALAPTLDVALVDTATPSSRVNERNVRGTGDIGSTMRFDTATSTYEYDFATKSLSDQSATYRFTITVPSSGQTVTVLFGVRK